MTDLTAKLNIKMTPAELAELKRDAYRHEMNMSEYVKYLIAKERKETK